MSNIFFRRLLLQRWRQFSQIDIEFDQQLTILTGGNGSGKSTLLRLLAQHFGWNATMLATPKIDKKGVTKYYIRESDLPPSTSGNREDIGSLEYSTGHRSAIWVPSESGAQYNVNFDSLASVDGINVSSHRPMPTYQAVAQIPTNPMRPEAAYTSYHSEILQRHQGGHTGFSPTYRMKEAIISMATFGPGNENVAPNEELRSSFNGFVEILKKILPSSIGFKSISVRLPDVVLVTESGEFVIDASSGGMMSLIDLAWQIYLFSLNHTKYVVVLDEPENHLHPSMQREVLGSLIKAFPDAQFVVATHSPFIVSSVRDSRVYVLKVEKDELSSESRVRSIFLEHADKAGTASEILRDVLGVPVTLPPWAESEVEQIANEFAENEISPQIIAALRTRLEAAGLGEYYPQALDAIVRRND